MRKVDARRAGEPRRRAREARQGPLIARRAPEWLAEETQQRARGVSQPCAGSLAQAPRIERDVIAVLRRSDDRGVHRRPAPRGLGVVFVEDEHDVRQASGPHIQIAPIVLEEVAKPSRPVDHQGLIHTPVGP